MSSGGGRPDGTIVVKVDPELAEMIPGYLERRHDDVARISRALEHGDFESVCIIGHQMKGSGAGYGLHGVTLLGDALERAARAGDANAISATLRELEDYLSRVTVAIDS